MVTVEFSKTKRNNKEDVFRLLVSFFMNVPSHFSPTLVFALIKVSLAVVPLPALVFVAARLSFRTKDRVQA